jgi:hypothetical protein
MQGGSDDGAGSDNDILYGEEGINLMAGEANDVFWRNSGLAFCFREAPYQAVTGYENAIMFEGLPLDTIWSMVPQFKTLDTYDPLSVVWSKNSNDQPGR